MSPRGGREALAEVARLELARIYGSTVACDHPRRTQAQLDEDAYTAAMARLAAGRSSDRHLRAVPRIAS